MRGKVKFILLFISLSICLSLMSSTYSRYVANATGNIEVLFAKWQILVNNNDITTNTTSTIDFTPVIEENEYTAANVIAPSSKGYFNINVDPTNVDVSFQYAINLAMDNADIPDLMITKYAILNSDYIEGDPMELIDLEDNIITNTLNYDKETENFKFETFTVRIYFEWYDKEDETMDDTADTEIGNLAATEGKTFTMQANITFEQVFN